MNYTDALLKSGRLLAAVPMFGLATGALFPIVALRLQDLGSDPAFIGLVTTVYYCGSFLAALTFGFVLSRIGYRLGFLVSAVIAAGATYALTLTESQIAWLLLRFIGGLSLGAYYVVVDGWFQALADRRSRGKVFATYETVRLAATALGPLLLVLGSVNGSLLIVGDAYIASIGPAFLTQEPNETARKTYRFTSLVEMARCFLRPFWLRSVAGSQTPASMVSALSMRQASDCLSKVSLSLWRLCLSRQRSVKSLLVRSQTALQE